MESDSRHRFSARVEDYARYRPSYPAAVIDLLSEHYGLRPNSAIADIGSGTGLLAKLFLDHGCSVAGVEPNAEMRAAGEAFLSNYPNFTSIDAQAEHTNLPASRFDFVTAGQAFHWFEPSQTRAEFRRILKPLAWVVLIWNERRVEPGFLDGYETLLHRYSTDYKKVDHRKVDEAALSAFFEHRNWKAYRFDYQQDFDWDGLRGRALSSSYVPLRSAPGHDELMAELRLLFDQYQTDKSVKFPYDTRVYVGQLN